MEERYYTPKELMVMFHKKEIRTVYYWIKTGKIKAANFSGKYYIPESEVQKMLQLKEVKKK